jgi:hypothetical protein
LVFLAFLIEKAFLITKVSKKLHNGRLKGILRAQKFGPPLKQNHARYKVLTILSYRSNKCGK